MCLLTSSSSTQRRRSTDASGLPDRAPPGAQDTRQRADVRRRASKAAWACFENQKYFETRTSCFGGSKESSSCWAAPCLGKMSHCESSQALVAGGSEAQWPSETSRVNACEYVGPGREVTARCARRRRGAETRRVRRCHFRKKKPLLSGGMKKLLAYVEPDGRIHGYRHDHPSAPGPWSEARTQIAAVEQLRRRGGATERGHGVIITPATTDWFRWIASSSSPAATNAPLRAQISDQLSTSKHGPPARKRRLCFGRIDFSLWHEVERSRCGPVQITELRSSWPRALQAG